MTFLITGCGRSGTHYTAKILRSIGIGVGHERRGRQGTVSSIWLVKDTKYPTYHDQHRPESFDRILLQTRNPVDAISSLTTALSGSIRWNARHIPIEVPDKTDKTAVLRTAGMYWVRWNLRALSVCDYQYKVESLEEEWETILELIGEPSHEFPSVRKNLNTRKHREYTWETIVGVLPPYERQMRGWLRQALGYTQQP